MFIDKKQSLKNMKNHEYYYAEEGPLEFMKIPKNT